MPNSRASSPDSIGGEPPPEDPEEFCGYEDDDFVPRRPGGYAVNNGGYDNAGDCNSPGAASNHSDRSVGRPAVQKQHQPWKQKAVQVRPADYYLNLLKAARGQAGKGAATGAAAAGRNKASPASNASPITRKASGGVGTEAFDLDPAMEKLINDGRTGYGDQMRARADELVEVQRQEENARQAKKLEKEKEERSCE